MNIKSIHIENFGNFKETDFDFNNGLNTKIEENGWGKSTLSAFIKAMFYGMDERGNVRNKNIVFERERFLPWKGGNFGGSLIFSHNGKDYKITRFFDSKKIKDDTFSVVDMTSKLETKDFTSEIGLEIFGINKESFERSCFVSLDSEKKPALNDDISAKLNNILQAGDDIGNCQEALESIATLLTNLSGKGKSTKKTLLTNAIQDDKDALRNIDSTENSIPSTKELLENAENMKTDAEGKLLILEAEKNNVVLFEQKKIYEDIKKNIEAENSKTKELLDFFNGNIPENSEIENLKKENNLFIQSKTELERNTITQSDKNDFEKLKDFFGRNIIQAADIEKCQEEINQKKKLEQEMASSELSSNDKAKLNALKTQFEQLPISNETIKQQLGYITEAKSLEQELKINIENQKNLENNLENANKLLSKKKKTFMLFTILSFVTFALGSVLSFIFFKNLIITGSLASISLVFIILCFTKKVKNEETKKISEEIKNIASQTEKMQNDLLKCQNAFTSFIKSAHKHSLVENPEFELSTIQNEYNSYTELLKKDDEYNSFVKGNKTLLELDKKIKAFTALFEEKTNISDVDKLLPILRKNLSDFENLSKSIPLFESAKRQEAISEKKLSEWLKNYKTNKTESFEKQIDCLKTKTLELQNSKIQLEDFTKKLEDFSKTHDMEKINSAKPSRRTLDEIQAVIRRGQDALQQYISNINSYKETLDKKYAEVDKKQSIENHLKNQEEENKKLDDKVNILNLTKKYLEEARDSLSNKYMGKMEKAFSKYLLRTKTSKDIFIDRELKVSIEENGKTHDSNYLSEGYKDLVNFYTRLALVDAMFENEKPVLILDDPFVNLDKDKIDNALNIVKEVAEDKQVIYFTCHNSRAWVKYT